MPKLFIAFAAALIVAAYSLSVIIALYYKSRFRAKGAVIFILIIAATGIIDHICLSKGD